MSDEPESGALENSCIHGGCPFDGQAEPELWLASKGAAMTTHLTMADAMHGGESSPEGFGRAVSITHGDRQQVFFADHVCRSNRHPPATDVLRHRHPGEGREHPTGVITRRAHRPRKLINIDTIAEVRFDLVDKVVEDFYHGCSPSPPSFAGPRPVTPDFSGSIRSDLHPPRGLACAVLPDELSSALPHQHHRDVRIHRGELGHG